MRGGLAGIVASAAASIASELDIAPPSAPPGRRCGSSPAAACCDGPIGAPPLATALRVVCLLALVAPYKAPPPPPTPGGGRVPPDRARVKAAILARTGS